MCSDDAGFYLRMIDTRGFDARPDGLIDRTLLTHPASFGDELAPVLLAARECVLRHGDESTRAALRGDETSEREEYEILRRQMVLRKRPSSVERNTPVLVHLCEDELVLALAHAIPEGGHRLSVRLQIDSHPESMYMSAQRTWPSEALQQRWHELGHTNPPHSVWKCEPPSWYHGTHALAIELTPNPSGFREAMDSAVSGAGRVLVTANGAEGERDTNEIREATVMPSGWLYLRADRPWGTRSLMPNGAPRPMDAVRVPDDDLFALCAARTWTVSLRDSIWLRRRPEFCVTDGTNNF